MPALTNVKYEAAAQAIACWQDVLNERHIWRADSRSNRQMANRFFNRPDVRSRVQDIITERVVVERKSTEMAVRKVGLTKEWVIERLMWLAERSLRGKPVMDANGKHTGEFFGKPDGSTAVRSLEAASDGISACSLIGMRSASPASLRG